MRVVSLLPSATVIIVALVAADDLVGVSHSCSGDWRHLPKLTRTWIDVQASSAEIDRQVRAADRPLYELDVQLLEQLAPDVVVSQSLCDVCAVPSGDVLEAVKALSSKPELIDLTPNRLGDVPGCFTQVGQAIGRAGEAASLMKYWLQVFNRYRGRHAERGLTAAFLDWLDPPFVAGHWMPDMLEWLGVTPVLAVGGQPSYAVTWQEIEDAEPDLIVAACCGFDAERSVAAAGERAMSIFCLDGNELFNRPSPKLIESLVALSAVIDEFVAD